MADVILQKTFGPRRDIKVFSDDTVTVNGVSTPATVTHTSEGITVALRPTEPDMLEVDNGAMSFAAVKITRQPGWQDSEGWRAELINVASEVTPNAIAIAVYDGPEATGYKFTTGAMVLDPKTELWTSVCPPGHEPAGPNSAIHFAVLLGSAKYTFFTLWEDRDEVEFTVSGLFAEGTMTEMEI